MLLDAEKLGLVEIQPKTKQTLEKIINSDKIGSGLLVKQDVGYYADPTKQEVIIQSTLVAIIKGLIKTYGDKASQHKFSLGSFMVWTSPGVYQTKPYVGQAYDAGELRTTFHGQQGRAIDINRPNINSFSAPEAMVMVKNILAQLPAGNYEIGLPCENGFFPDGTAMHNPDIGGKNETYKLLNSKDFLAFIVHLKNNGRNIKMFADYKDHLHLAVMPYKY
jgi:hypothetical protein